MIIAVLGAAPAVGTSTVAANMATLMAATGPTILIELSGHNTLMNALGLTERMQEGNYPTVLNWKQGSFLKTRQGLDVLPGSDQMPSIEPSLGVEIVKEISRNYQHVLLDLGPLKEEKEALYQQAGMTLLVTELSERCLIRRALPKEYHLVVNKVSKKNIYHPRDMERWFNVSYGFHIPENITAAKKSIQTRVPILYCGKNVANAYEEMILALTGDFKEKNTSFLSWFQGKVKRKNETKEAEPVFGSISQINGDPVPDEQECYLALDDETVLSAPVCTEEQSLRENNIQDRIQFMLNGQIGPAQSLEKAKQKLSMMTADAVFLEANMPRVREVIKELRRVTKSPLVVIGETNASLIEAGADECFTEINSDVIKIVQTKAQKLKELWKKANIDELTGCYQRNFLDECISMNIHNFMEKQIPFAVLTFDMDRFKDINDTNGHNAGDEVLNRFGSHLLDNCRKLDVPIRVGGDEFIVVLPNRSIELARLVGERIKSTWNGKFNFPTGVVESRFSMGLAEVGRDGLTQEEILAAADYRMYQEKDSRKKSLTQIQGNRIDIQRRKSNLFALISDANPEGLAAFSIYMANTASNNGFCVTLIDCYLDRPLIGSMLKVSKRKDWRSRGINATVIFSDEMKVIPLSPQITDNYKVEQNFKDLLDELGMISKEGIIVLNFGTGSQLYELIKDYANIIRFKISSSSYQYQTENMSHWDLIPYEPEYARDTAILNMLVKMWGEG